MTITGKINASSSLLGSVNAGGSGKKEVLSDTTANWNSKRDLISVKDTVYVYTDFDIVDGKKVPNIKIGDGNAYLIDLPFIASSGVSEQQINFWNNKVSVIIDPTDPENLILYTNDIEEG